MRGGRRRHATKMLGYILRRNVTAQRKHVNTVDLFEWLWSDAEDKVQTFRGVAKLRAYSKGDK